MKLYLNHYPVIKLFHRIKNLASRFLDPDFNSFKKFEFKVVPTDELNDLGKLRYVRDLNLAESGFINTALKEQLTLLKNRARLFQMDRNILPIGRISIYEDENKLMTLLLGYSQEGKRAYISYNKVNNCPVWHKYAVSSLREKVQHLYPSRSDHLFMKHRYFHMDTEQLNRGTQRKLLGLFNDTLQSIYLYNQHLQKGIQHIVPPIGDPPKLSNELPIQIKKGMEGLFVPATIGKNVVVLVPYLKIANENNRLYLSTTEFRSLLGQRSITVIAKTKYGVSLGTHDDRLYLKATNSVGGSDSLQRWTLLDDFLESENAPKRLKYEIVKNVIEKKDFLISQDEIMLRRTNDALLLKKHYGSGRTYFAVAHNGKKPKLTDYRPIAVLKDEYPEHYDSYREHLNDTDSAEQLGTKQKRGTKLSV